MPQPVTVVLEDARQTPPWMDRLHRHPHFACEADVPTLPEGRRWQFGCYRRRGHTGRHLGIVSRPVSSGLPVDSWAVWGER